MFGGAPWLLQGPAAFESVVTVTGTETTLTFAVDWPLLVGVTVLALG